jgi:DNA adenine methylase
MSRKVENIGEGGRRGLSPIYLDNPDISGKVIILRRPTRHRIVFGWYGGKFSHLDWLLPLLPYTHCYSEPFSGSAAVLLNRNPSPVETYNDIDGDVVNFFRMLRDRSDDLIRAIALTPFSREEFHQAISGSMQGISDLERARHFYIRARQARTGLAQTATLGRWANCKNTSREIAERLLRVQIENRPAMEVIRIYDSAITLFYCDPPYLHETRGDSKAYGFEMDFDHHQQLSQVLNKCRGKVALSGYRCDNMDTWYKGWRRFDAPVKQCHSIKQLRQECLWMNY